MERSEGDRQTYLFKLVQLLVDLSREGRVDPDVLDGFLRAELQAVGYDRVLSMRRVLGRFAYKLIHTFILTRQKGDSGRA
jgi:hypothetical protein